MAGGTLSAADARAILQSTESHIANLFGRLQGSAGSASTELGNLASQARTVASQAGSAAGGMAAAAAAGHAFANIPQQVSTQIASEMRSSFSGTGGLIAGLAGDSLGNAAKILAGQFGAVGGGMNLLGSGIAAATGAGKGLGGAFSKMMPQGLGLQMMMKGVTGGLGLLGASAGVAVNFLNDNLKTWQNLSTSGIALGGSMESIAQAAAGTMLSFGQLSSHLTRNSEALAVLGGTADRGADAFMSMMISMRDNQNTYADSSRSFMYVMDNLGITSDESSSLIGTMISDMSMAAVYRNMSDEAAQHATADYIVQLDQLAKLTGKSREEMAKQAQQASLNAQVQAAIMDMDEDQALAAKHALTEVQKEGPQAVNAMMAAIAGAPVLDDAGMLYATTEMGTTIRALGEGIRSGNKTSSKDLDDFRSALVPAREATLEFIKDFVKMGPALGGDFAKMTQIWETGLFAEFTKTEAIIQAYAQKLGISADKVNYLDALKDSMDASRGVARDDAGKMVSIASESTQAITRLNTTMNLLTAWLTGKAGEILFRPSMDANNQPQMSAIGMIDKVIDKIGAMNPDLAPYKAPGDTGAASVATVAEGLFDAVRESGGSVTNADVVTALRERMSLKETQKIDEDNNPMFDKQGKPIMVPGFAGHAKGISLEDQDRVIRGMLEREGEMLAIMAGANTEGASGADITKANYWEPILRPLQELQSKISPGEEMGLKGERVKAQISNIQEKATKDLSIEDLTATVLKLGEDAKKEREAQAKQKIEEESAVMRHALVGEQDGSLLDGFKGLLVGNNDSNLLDGFGNAISSQGTKIVDGLGNALGQVPAWANARPMQRAEDDGTSLVS